MLITACASGVHGAKWLLIHLASIDTTTQQQLITTPPPPRPETQHQTAKAMTLKKHRPHHTSSQSQAPGRERSENTLTILNRLSS